MLQEIAPEATENAYKTLTQRIAYLGMDVHTGLLNRWSLVRSQPGAISKPPIYQRITYTSTHCAILSDLRVISHF